MPLPAEAVAASNPAENARSPAPVSRTARTSSVPSNRSTAASISSSVSVVIVFIRWGRSISICPTLPSTETVIDS
jgi:short subunit fatty acids transporter